MRERKRKQSRARSAPERIKFSCQLSRPMDVRKEEHPPPHKVLRARRQPKPLRKEMGSLSGEWHKSCDSNYEQR